MKFKRTHNLTPREVEYMKKMRDFVDKTIEGKQNIERDTLSGSAIESISAYSTSTRAISQVRPQRGQARQFEELLALLKNTIEAIIEERTDIDEESIELTRRFVSALGNLELERSNRLLRENRVRRGVSIGLGTAD